MLEFKWHLLRKVHLSGKWDSSSHGYHRCKYFCKVWFLITSINVYSYLQCLEESKQYKDTIEWVCVPDCTMIWFIIWWQTTSFINDQWDFHFSFSLHIKWKSYAIEILFASSNGEPDSLDLLHSAKCTRPALSMFTNVHRMCEMLIWWKMCT